MTSLLEGAKQLVTRGTDIGARIEGLEAAAEAASGRLDEALVTEAREVADRAAGRLRLSAEHTVVGIAGATGSGKSSTFNALTGLELSAVGVRRPTTSWATACVWGTDGARELLEWLGIPDRHQTTRDSMLDTRREDNALDGVVLLDLPDHDSTEVSHHLEVDRLVALADLLVWVLDPQKYADAAIHDRYLEPLKTHDEVMVVVLNHIDSVPEERRQAMLDDVRRLLDNDGLAKVPVIAISARQGIGLDELRAEIGRRVAEKKMTRTRLEADIRAAAGRLDAASGEGRTRSLPAGRAQSFETALGEAAGVPTVVDAVERSTRIRATRATGWPAVSWIAGLRGDPLKKLELDVGDSAGRLSGRATAAPTSVSVQRARVDTEVRALADDASEGLGAPWAASVQRVSVSRIPELGDRLDAALAATDLGGQRLPGWVSLVRVLQWLLLLGAVGCGIWAGLAAAGVTGDAPEVGGLAVPLVVAVACVVVGIALALVCRGTVAGAAKERAESVRKRLEGSISEVASELVVRPVEAELAAYSALKSGVAKAQRA
ncbi:YfjP family GTPase [Nocardioides lianchengensis]|uniref:50S ribosome-binding GTPase n=1 Tax=Nocardioides lianchengensis TaxID=1045774 RepID=A0A1G6UP15_9ACTN|nr:YfjP family GTPase [Nocardioides lianchengensis]NYG10973.1 GTP-binding protein EngB required for normal cell division [Nocardioides lianchengensis]SDD42295.1 50S ribosome-binding GTPase [Nocardioides lianchengensis]